MGSNMTTKEVFDKYGLSENPTDKEIIEAMKTYAENVGERVRDVAAIRIYTENSEITLAKMKIIRDINISDFIQ